MWPRFAHRLVGVGCGQHPAQPTQHRTRQPAVVARTVQPLMVGAGNRGEIAQRRGRCGDPFRVVGVQADPLPLIGRQLTRLLPHRRADRDPAEVVDQPCSTHRGHLVGVQTQMCRGVGGQLRDAG